MILFCLINKVYVNRDRQLINCQFNFIKKMRNSFVLQSVLSTQDISKSNLNTSKSKHLWSFAKDSRFKKTLPYCDTIYNISGQLKRKGSAIGYGNKSDFTKDLTCSPGSSRYKLDTLFDKNRKSKKGFSMYQNRQKIPSRGYIPLQPLKTPGPGVYSPIKKRTNSPQYSLRPKTKILDKRMSIQSQNTNPAPGTYQNPQELSATGKYAMSKHKGTGSKVFNPRRSARFFNFKNNNPGPGNYQHMNMTSNDGKYMLTNTHGHGKRYFDKEHRQVIFQFKAKHDYNPGPGSYRLPSDFGHYDGEVYQSTGAIAYMSQSTKLRSSNVSLRNSMKKL